MSASPLESSNLPNGMVKQLAKAVRLRYHSAMLEGKSEEQAFEEVVNIILGTYREALAS